MRFRLLCPILLLLFMPAAQAATCPPSRTLAFVVERKLARSAPGFTEGLEVHDGALWESTGDLFGNSGIDRIDLKTGQVHTLMDAGKRYFGEGLTVFDGRVYQMTWREHRVFVFDRALRPLEELTNPREGWGLTHDASRLIASDGSSRLYFLSPRDFSTLSSLEVRDGDDPVRNLNELEYAGGAVWANVFETWTVAKIDPASGCVTATADITRLKAHMTAGERAAIARDQNFVPNGIAFDPASGLFALTGKFWPMVFLGHFVEE